MSNGSTVSSEATYLSFLDDLTALGEVAGRVRDRLTLLAPSQRGSYLRLVQETAQGMRESQEGKGKTFATAQDAIEDLERLTQTYAGKTAAKV